MPEVIVNERDVDWMTVSAYPGLKLKILAVDKETKAHAIMVKWEPGVSVTPHAHPSLEHAYVLDGAWEYKGKVYGPGTYFIFPAGYEHGPFRSGEKGLVTLSILQGCSGLEETVPEFEEYSKHIGLIT